MKRLYRRAKNWIIENIKYVSLCWQQIVADYIILRLGKIPSHYECVWSNCNECGAEKGKPCKRLWRCESRAKLISEAIIQFTAETNKKCKEKYEQWQIEKLKGVVAHWT